MATLSNTEIEKAIRAKNKQEDQNKKDEKEVKEKEKEVKEKEKKFRQKKAAEKKKNEVNLRNESLLKKSVTQSNEAAATA